MFGNSAIYRRSDHFLLHPLRLVTLQRQFIDEQPGELIPAVPHKPIVSGGLTSVGLLCRGVVAVNNRPQPLPIIVPGFIPFHTSLQTLGLDQTSPPSALIFRPSISQKRRVGKEGVGTVKLLE